jgi:hypothetical protein
MSLHKMRQSGRYTLGHYLRWYGTVGRLLEKKMASSGCRCSPNPRPSVTPSPAAPNRGVLGEKILPQHPICRKAFSSFPTPSRKYERVKAAFPEAEISTVGHSLGGTLADHVGRKHGVKSVAFTTLAAHHMRRPSATCLAAQARPVSLRRADRRHATPLMAPHAQWLRVRRSRSCRLGLN